MFDYYCTQAQGYFTCICYMYGFGCSCAIKSKRVLYEFSHDCDVRACQDLRELRREINAVINARTHPPLQIPSWSAALGDDPHDALLRYFFFEDAFEILTGIHLTFFDLIDDHLIPRLPKYAKTITERMIEEMGTAFWRKK